MNRNEDVEGSGSYPEYSDRLAMKEAAEEFERRPKKQREGYVESLALFERKGMILILVYLYRNGACPKTELYNAISNDYEMLNKINRLRKAGYVALCDRVHAGSQLVMLTDRGAETAELFLKIDELSRAEY